MIAADVIRALVIPAPPLDSPPLTLHDLVMANIVGDVFNAALFIIGGLVLAWLKLRGSKPDASAGGKSTSTSTSPATTAKLLHLANQLRYAVENYDALLGATTIDDVGSDGVRMIVVPQLVKEIERLRTELVACARSIEEAQAAVLAERAQAKRPKHFPPGPND